MIAPAECGGVRDIGEFGARRPDQASAPDWGAGCIRSFGWHFAGTLSDLTLGTSDPSRLSDEGGRPVDPLAGEHLQWRVLGCCDVPGLSRGVPMPMGQYPRNRKAPMPRRRRSVPLLLLIALAALLFV